jgi:hypothetical protein
VKRTTKKNFCHSYLDVEVVKYDLSHREDVLCIPDTKRILLSNLEVFELTHGEKSGLVIGVAMDEREKMVAYVLSLRQGSEIRCARWKIHIHQLKKTERSSILQQGIQKISLMYSIFMIVMANGRTHCHENKPRTSQQAMNAFNS